MTHNDSKRATGLGVKGCRGSGWEMGDWAWARGDSEGRSEVSRKGYGGTVRKKKNFLCNR
jgi:hypothetical protein